MPAIPGANDAFVVATVDPPRDLVLTGGGTLSDTLHIVLGVFLLWVVVLAAVLWRPVRAQGETL